MPPFHDLEARIAQAAAAGQAEAARVADRVKANAAERQNIARLEELVRYGFKFIDITVRKDGQEYRFEGDWLARLFRDVNRI